MGYIEGDLRVTERLCVDVHLTQCYTCREELDDWRHMLEILRESMRHPEPLLDFEALRARMALADAAPDSTPRFRRGWKGMLRPAAAAAVLLFTAGVIVPFLSTAPSASDSSSPAVSEDTSLWRMLNERNRDIEMGSDLDGRTPDEGPPPVSVPETDGAV